LLPTEAAGFPTANCALIGLAVKIKTHYKYFGLCHYTGDYTKIIMGPYKLSGSTDRADQYAEFIESHNLSGDTVILIMKREPNKTEQRRKGAPAIVAKAANSREVFLRTFTLLKMQ
jgi:hypothetical protein